MQLHFRNSYRAQLWVAIMFYDPQRCANDGNWGTRGWWGMNPGEERYVLNTNNRYAAFYAEAADGAIWSGPYGPVYVTQAPFDSCVNIGSTSSRIVGMRLVDMNGYSSYTVNLIP